jgi:hypothetical protein
MTAAAFTAWLQGAGDKQTFNEFLTGLGLVEKEKQLPKEKKKQLTNKSRRTAEKILAMAKRQRRKK